MGARFPLMISSMAPLTLADDHLVDPLHQAVRRNSRRMIASHHDMNTRVGPLQGSGDFYRMRERGGRAGKSNDIRILAAFEDIRIIIKTPLKECDINARDMLLHESPDIPKPQSLP